MANPGTSATDVPGMQHRFSLEDNWLLIQWVHKGPQRCEKAHIYARRPVNASTDVYCEKSVIGGGSDRNEDCSLLAALG